MIDNFLIILLGLTIFVRPLLVYKADIKFTTEHGGQPSFISALFQGATWALIIIVASGLTWYFFGIKYALGIAVFITIIPNIVYLFDYHASKVLISIILLGISWYFFGMTIAIGLTIPLVIYYIYAIKNKKD